MRKYDDGHGERRAQRGACVVNRARRLASHASRVTQGAQKKGAKAKDGKTIEQIYQKKTQLEHILLRPDTYGARRPPTTP